MSKRNPQSEPKQQQPLQKNAPPLSAVQVSQSQVNISSGPIPSPETLAQYEKQLPGTAERILLAFETEYRHRHQLAEMAMQGDIEAMRWTHRNHRMGQLLGFTVCLVAICLGSFLVHTGHDLAGGSIGGVGLASVIAAYYKGQSKDQPAQKSN